VTGGTYNRSNDATYPATVGDFRLDKYEVTVGRFRKFVDAVVAGWRPAAGSGKHAYLNSGNGLANSGTGSSYEPGWDTAWNQADTTYRMYATKADWDSSLACNATYQTWTASAGSNETRPINCVNWYQSHAFCIWDEGFLASEAEWNYAAAGGSEQRSYPWGSTVPGTNANLAVYGCYYNGSGTCTGVTNIAPVGSVPAGNGRYGQSDLAGNVWEWTLDWYATYTNPCNNCSYVPATASGLVLRGGSFNSGASSLLSSYRNGGTPASRDGSIGARCARSAP
jgi:formylglycine-generating enzyme required for sulfatase activity